MNRSIGIEMVLQEVFAFRWRCSRGEVSVLSSGNVHIRRCFRAAFNGATVFVMNARIKWRIVLRTFNIINNNLLMSMKIRFF
jgi:hypothetical protein